MWVRSLGPGTVFTVRDVPGERRSALNVLSRMTQAPDAQLHRLARGIYYLSDQRRRDGTWLPRPAGRLTAARVQLSGRPGCGLGWVTATHGVGWIWQASLTDHIAVLRDRHGNVPTPPLPGLVYLRRSNQRRAELNWAEVTVLEALRDYTILGNHETVDRFEWEQAMATFVCDRKWRQYGSQLRLDRLEWAAHGEPAAHLDTIFRGLGEVTRAVERKRADEAD